MRRGASWPDLIRPRIPKGHEVLSAGASEGAELRPPHAVRSVLWWAGHCHVPGVPAVVVGFEHLLTAERTSAALNRAAVPGFPPPHVAADVAGPPLDAKGVSRKVAPERLDTDVRPESSVEVEALAERHSTLSAQRAVDFLGLKVVVRNLAEGHGVTRLHRSR